MRRSSATTAPASTSSVRPATLSRRRNSVRYSRSVWRASVRKFSPHYPMAISLRPVPAAAHSPCSCCSNSNAWDSPPAHYFILEISSALRARQRALFTENAPHLLERIQWLESLPSAGFRGIVLGNELLDAMPVERFRVGADGVTQLRSAGRKIALSPRPRAVRCHPGVVWRETLANDALRDRLTALGLPEGYISEIGFAAEGWVRSVADILEQGVLLLVDYGFPGHEFYHPQRATGTLMCHYRHRAHDDPLLFVGLQDITAHVDFTAVAKAGTESGLSLLGYASQALFLLGCGLDDIAARTSQSDARAYLQFTNEVKKLTLPHEMGELFKVIAFGRGVDTPLAGFRLQDRRGRL